METNNSELKRDLDYYKNRLRKLRDDYSDEIPEEILSGMSPEKEFKVRRNWWQGLVGSLINAKRQNLITDPEILREIDDFTSHYKSKSFHHQSLTTEEDLKRAHRIIALFLGEEK